MPFEFQSVAVVVAGCLLAVYVLAAGAGLIIRRQLFGVAVAAVVWAVWPLLGNPDSRLADYAGRLGVEFLLLLSWFYLLERLLRGPYLQSMPELVRRGVRWVWGGGIAIAVAALLATGRLAAALPLPEVLYGVTLVLALLAFVLAGHFFRDATVEPFSAVRAISIAATLVVGLQSFVFAHALLVGEMPPGLRGVRSAGLLAALGLLAYTVHVMPQWSLAIFVSPQARLYAPRLLGAIVGLLLILAGVPLLRYSGAAVPAWVPPLYVATICAGLLLVMFSERLRGQLRVFVSKHFLPFRYDYREEWLRLIDTLASPGQDRPLPERAIQALAQIVGSPAGVLWMRSGEDGPFQCLEAWGTSLKPDETVSSRDPIVAFMRERQWILDTAELDRQPELYPGIRRPDWLGSFPDALLIVPLFSSEAVIGFVVLFQSSSAFRLTFEEIDLLRTSGRQVAAHLAQYHADRQLSEARQFEAFNRLTAFVMHDLKNLIAQQSLMVKNAAKHKDNPAFFEDAMATIANSVARMNKLLQQLQTGDEVGPARLVNLSNCVRDAIKKCEGRRPEPAYSEPSRDVKAYIDGDRLTTVLAHLIRNAQDATPDDGQISIRVQDAGANSTVTVQDTGCGMEDEFVRHRLFRPFDTTKGSQGMGVGAYQARAFIVASGGSMKVESEPGAGTTIRVQLPAVEPSVE